jgi:steroid delta-isomerase-like uncharacterized protein
MNSDPAIGGVETQSDARTTREDIIAMFNRRQQAWEDLDAAALAADYADDVVVESPFAGTHRGRAAAEQALRAVFSAFVDAKLRTEDVIVDGSRVAHVIMSEGTHMGEFLGMAPTGKPFRLRFVCIHDVEDGKIIRERRIYDFTGLLMQIGVLKARPV